MRSRRALSVLLLFVVAACGKRGDPRPPVPIIPQATSDLVVTQRGTRLLLSWSYPSLTTSGQSLSHVQRVVVFRYLEELPVPTVADPATERPAELDPTVPQAVAQFSRVPTVAPPQFAKLRTRIDSIEGANLPAATTGARLTFEDSPPFRSTDGRPVRVTYAVVTEGRAARSEVSNLATIVPLDVPVAPPALTATARAEGVVLQWQAPTTAATGGDMRPVLIGYNVYRYPVGETPDELATPINPAPVTGATYTDVPPYGKHEYRVTAVSAAGPPRIESLPSGGVVAEFRDLVPPAPPAGLTALVETTAVRLVWDAVDAPDLAGYKVYRTEGTGTTRLRPVGRIQLTPQPIADNNFRDTIASPGISFFYEVTSVDRSGNESKPVKTDWVLVPKTP